MNTVPPNLAMSTPATTCSVMTNASCPGDCTSRDQLAVPALASRRHLYPEHVSPGVRSRPTAPHRAKHPSLDYPWVLIQYVFTSAAALCHDRIQPRQNPANPRSS